MNPWDSSTLSNCDLNGWRVVNLHHWTAAFGWTNSFDCDLANEMNIYCYCDSGYSTATTATSHHRHWCSAIFYCANRLRPAFDCCCGNSHWALCDACTDVSETSECVNIIHHHAECMPYWKQKTKKNFSNFLINKIELLMCGTRMMLMKTPNAETVIIAFASISKFMSSNRLVARNSRPSVNIQIPKIERIAPRTSTTKKCVK